LRKKDPRNYFELPNYPKLKFPWYSRPPDYLWRILRQYVYERDEGKCRDCGKEVELYECNIHHVFELNQGGTNHPTNLKTLCKDCHKKRHPFMMDAKDKMRLQENYLKQP
jgi:5-methylcytosine-specific restriction endonuclease McrA